MQFAYFCLLVTRQQPHNNQHLRHKTRWQDDGLAQVVLEKSRTFFLIRRLGQVQRDEDKCENITQQRFVKLDSRLGIGSVNGPSNLVEGVKDSTNTTIKRTTIRKKTKVGLQFTFTFTTTIRCFLCQNQPTW